MATTKVILTNYGNDQVLNAIAQSTNVEISYIAYGDGGGTSYVPQPTQTNLVNQLGTISAVTKTFDPIEGFIYFSGTIPGNTPSFTLREFGLVDINGGLIAVAVVPDTAKPDASEAIEVTLPISIGFRTSVGSVITVYIGDSEYASKSWVTDNFQIISEKGVANGYAPLNADGIVPTANVPVSFQILGDTTVII